MFKKAIEKWRPSKAIEVGHCFQSRYYSHRRRREQGQTSKYGRLFNIFGGPVLIVAGFVFMLTPGPSYIIVIGLWMLAGEYLPLARFFDRLEVRLRKLGRWIKGAGRPCPPWSGSWWFSCAQARWGTGYTVWSQAASE